MYIFSERHLEYRIGHMYINKIKKNSSSARLLVKVTGYPRPTIKWHTDGVAVEVTETRTVETYEDGTSALTLHKTTLEDCGEYVCEAMNRNGVDTTVTTLVVLPGMHALCSDMMLQLVCKIAVIIFCNQLLKDSV